MMVNARLVPIAEVYPRMCVCGTQDGPLVDTHMDILEARLYLCKGCGKQVARLFGFANGEELERLSNAAAELDRAGKQLETQAERIKAAEDKIAELAALNEELAADRDHALGEAAQLKHIARAIEAQTHELVGDHAA